MNSRQRTCLWPSRRRGLNNCLKRHVLQTPYRRGRPASGATRSAFMSTVLCITFEVNQIKPIHFNGGLGRSRENEVRWMTTYRVGHWGFYLEESNWNKQVMQITISHGLSSDSVSMAPVSEWQSPSPLHRSQDGIRVQDRARTSYSAVMHHS